jgi:hypothetical protein
MRDERHDSSWEADWSDHAERQRERMARWPLADKLRWLEQAHRLAQRLSTPSTEDRTPRSLEKFEPDRASSDER